MSEHWSRRAACARVEAIVLELAHGKEAEQRLFARKVCRGAPCPVRAECLADAMTVEAGMSADKRFGALGGFAGVDRAKLARGLSARCVDCPEVIVPRLPAQVRCDLCQHRWKYRTGDDPGPEPVPVGAPGPLPCGTRAGHVRHLRKGEKPCWACRHARSEYDRALRARRSVA